MKQPHSKTTFQVLFTLGFAAVACTPVFAGPGHDHGEASTSNQSQSTPRFTASTGVFELVGVLDKQGKQLTLYLDKSKTNEPILGAQIELDIEGDKYKAIAQGDVYISALTKPLKAGVVAITATIAAGSETDLLTAELDIHVEEKAIPAAKGLMDKLAHWGLYLGVGFASLLGLVGIARFVRRKRAKPGAYN